MSFKNICVKFVHYILAITYLGKVLDTPCIFVKLVNYIYKRCSKDLSRNYADVRYCHNFSMMVLGSDGPKAARMWPVNFDGGGCISFCHCCYTEE